MNSFIIKDINISFNDIFKIINEDLNLSIHSSVIDKINSSRSYLEKKITDSDESYYGINTGFGDLQNFKIGGMPQQATSLGLKYNAPKYWYAGINFNYFRDIYLSPNPDRRTAEAISAYGAEYPYREEIIDQTKLSDGNAVNLFCGKSWKIYKNCP